MVSRVGFGQGDYFMALITSKQRESESFGGREYAKLGGDAESSSTIMLDQGG